MNTKTPEKAKKSGGLNAVSFAEALEHMKANLPAVRVTWQHPSEGIQDCRLLDNGLGRGGEFGRRDTQGRTTRYQLSAEDILADDWRLL